MRFVIRGIALLIMLYAVAAFIQTVVRQHDAGIIAGTALWDGFWFLLGLVLWRRTGRQQRVTGVRAARKGRLFWLLAGGIGVLLLVLLDILLRATIQPFRVDGYSMSPALHDGDFLLVNKVSYRFSTPRRGDIIVFKFPGDTARDFDERVIGLPGETVQIAHEVVSINGVPLAESYLPASQRPTYTYGPYTVPPDTVFVLGDNRNHSFDSHAWGTTSPLTENLIVGKLLLVYGHAARTP